MEQLIRDLNSPQNQGNPSVINELQRKIQQLQQQREAWQTGIELLNCEEQLLQFYGALTISLKVSADWENDRIGHDRALFAQLIEQLLTSFVRLAASPGKDIVLNKLCSTLAAIFEKRDSAWAHPCRHVFACVTQGVYVPEEQSPPVLELLKNPSSLAGAALRAVLRLTLTLQEAARSKTQHGHSIDVKLSNNSTDVWQTLHYAIVSYATYSSASVTQSSYALRIDLSEAVAISVLADTLQQIPLWCKEISRSSDSDAGALVLAKEVVHLVITLLEQPAAAELSIACIAALQSDQPRFLNNLVAGHVSQVISSNAAAHWTSELLRGDFSPAANYFLEYLEAVISQADTTTDDFLRQDSMPQVLQLVQTLLKCEGIATVEDKAAQATLDIVTCLAEGYSDWSGPSDFDESMQTFVRQSCLQIMAKSRFPLEALDSSTSSWDEDDFTEFEDYRFQASDFFQTAFGILGSLLAEMVTSSISEGSASWPEFESALFVLTAISDALSNEPEKCDPYIVQIFSSSIWTQATTAGETIPSRVRRAMIKLLSETTTFLQRSPQYLISCLDFLFRSLSLRTHSNQAARAVYNLCDSQRSYLVAGLPQFMQTITTLRNLPLHSSCKIIAGVSALIQALPSEEQKVQPISQLLQLIQDLEDANRQSLPTQDDEVYNPLFDRLSMLAAVAKGLQTPADTPIDLESTPANKDFWTAGAGKSTQDAILHMLQEPWSSLLQPTQSDLVAAVCDFLKAGFKEQHPMPTKFPAHVSSELLSTIISLQNPNLDQTMHTASCFISSVPDFSADLMNRVLGITQEAAQLISDPNFAAPTCTLDFFMRSMPKFGLQILNHPNAVDIMQAFIDYALLLLRTSDTLPRRSAAAFFVSLVDMTEITTVFMQSPGAAATVLSNLFNHYTRSILGLAMHLLAGECARSEIDSLSSLLRAFIAKQPMRAKPVLVEAVGPNGVLTPKALEATKPELRARFIAQIEALRGARKTNELVKEFWLNCRGGQFGYVT